MIEASLVAQLVKNPPAMQETLVWFLGLEGPLENSWASPVAQIVKYLPAKWDTWIQSLGWEDPLEEGNPLQYSCLENPYGQKSLVGCSPWGREETQLSN